MLNLPPFQKKGLFDLYKEIRDSRKDKSYTQALQVIDAAMLQQFGTFSIQSTANTLENITSLAISEDNKNRLRKLYSLKNKIIQEIKNEVTTNGRGRGIAECQYCTINSISSMDHVMPKSDFPEFSVNAQNLFPSCIECNNYKSETWLRDGKRQFLNLYLDMLPEDQYLFVDLSYLDGTINARFYLENRDGINEEVFNLISRHYENLHLMRRFSEVSNTVITSLKSTLTSLPKPMNVEEVKSFIRNASTKNDLYFGSNYWKTVLQVALCESDEFLELCDIHA